MPKDNFVKFTSHLGNSFVAPSRFTMYDKGDTFALKSPDEQALICAVMYTAAGSGTFSEFCEMMAPAVQADTFIPPKAADWTTIALSENRVTRRCTLNPVSELDSAWWFYGVDGGLFYHAITLRVSKLVLKLNGEFYENIVRTFDGVYE